AVRLHPHRLAGPLDRGPDVLEVEPLRDLLGGLVQRVVDLLVVDLAHDVERRVSHARTLSDPAPTSRMILVRPSRGPRSAEGSDQAAGGGPAGQLVPVGQL